MTLLIEAPAGADGLVVQRSAHWGYNSIAIVSGGEACAVDPGLSPGEITRFRGALEAGQRRIGRVVLTHSHHDHIRGWQSFPGAEIWGPELVAAKDAGARSRILAAKAEFDGRLGALDPDFRYPELDHTFGESASFKVGTLDVLLQLLPGHSNCTSVVIVPALHTLLCADYLVTPGLPYCRFEAAAFENAQERILELVRRHDIRCAVPAHNQVLSSREAIEAAVAEELDYFRALRREVERCLDEGLDGGAAARRCAAFMGERRGVDLGARALQDLDNARRVLAECP